MARVEIGRPRHKVRILLADDYPPWRAQARELLRRWPDCHITEACDGMEAVQKAAELRPDIVLLDVDMPVLNGIEAANKIREVNPQSRIVFVTQDGDADLKAAALAAGAEAYVLKANAATELLPVIAAALQCRY